MSVQLPIRIAIVAPSLHILGGQAVQAARLLEGWADDPDVHAWLVPINPVPPKPFDWLLRVTGVRTLVTQACYWPRLLRDLRTADIVHVFSASYFSFLLAPLPAIVVGRLLGKRVVVNYRSGEASDHLRRSMVARVVLRRADAIVVPSTYLRDVFASFGMRADVVANTIDLSRFRYRERTPLRPLLLSTRNLEPLYNVACTLRAFARVQRRVPEAALVVVGAGSQEMALRSLAERLGLQHVTFAGRVPPEEIANCYAAADVYVQTPSIDNMPGSALEAFASGLPVVATAVGGVPAILTDHVHGLLARDDDDEAVAECILALLASPDLARGLAAAARDACEPYQWPVVRAQWLAVYRDMVHGAKRSTTAEVSAA